MTLPEHFFGALILMSQGIIFVMQLKMHIANKEHIATLHDIAQTAQDHERAVLQNMAGLITAIKEASPIAVEATVVKAETDNGKHRRGTAAVA